MPDIRQYLTANRPQDDESTLGGAAALAVRPLEAQFSAAAQPEIVSSAAGDTMNVTIVGRLASGSIDEETLALDGTTPVLFTTTFERILTVTIASGPAGTVELRQGTGGTVRHEFAPGETGAAILFIGAGAEPAGGAAVVRYDKVAKRNEDATAALLGAEVELITDAAELFEIGVATAQDDAVSVADRLTAPGGVTFVDDGVAQAVPGDDLAAESYIGVWIRQTAPAGASAQKPTFTTRISGSSA